MNATIKNILCEKIVQLYTECEEDYGIINSNKIKEEPWTHIVKDILDNEVSVLDLYCLNDKASMKITCVLNEIIGFKKETPEHTAFLNNVLECLDPIQLDNLPGEIKYQLMNQILLNHQKMEKLFQKGWTLPKANGISYPQEVKWALEGNLEFFQYLIHYQPSFDSKYPYQLEKNLPGQSILERIDNQIWLSEIKNQDEVLIKKFQTLKIILFNHQLDCDLKKNNKVTKVSKI